MMKHEDKIIKNIYAAFVVSLFMTFLPNIAAAVIAMILFIGVLIAAYVFRAKADDTSLLSNHMTFIIRTMWIAGFFALFSMTAASIYVLQYYDRSLLDSCMQDLINSGVTDVVTLENMLKPCMDNFIHANKDVFLKGTFIGAAPIILYMLYRMAKGIARAAKGHRIGEVKSWF